MDFIVAALIGGAVGRKTCDFIWKVQKSYKSRVTPLIPVIKSHSHTEKCQGEENKQKRGGEKLKSWKEFPFISSTN